jgi:hypothetical protein
MRRGDGWTSVESLRHPAKAASTRDELSVASGSPFEPPELPEERSRHAHDPEGAGRRNLGALIGAAAAYAAIASTLLLVPPGTFFGHGLAVVAGSVAFAHLLALLRWCGKSYFRAPHLKRMLWRIFLTRLLIEGAIIFSGYQLSSADVLTLIATLGFGALFISHMRTPKRVAKRIDQKGAPRPKQVKKRIRTDHETNEINVKVPRSVAEVTSELLDLFGRWPRIPRLAPPVVALMLILCATALAVGVTTHKWIGGQEKQKQIAVVTTPTPTTPAAPPPSPQVSPPNGPPVELPAEHEEWNGECRRVEQRSGATPKAIHAMQRLYGDELGLTSLQEGCYGQIVRQHYTVTPHKREAYFTTIGTNLLTGGGLSFGIDSERFGTVLFLWSVASLVKAIVATMGPVGGIGRFPYYEVAGGGEVILIRCRVSVRVGNIALIRRGATEAWVELPPTAARAWFGRMKAVHKWLWPSQAETQPDGETLYKLQTSEGSPRGTIHLFSDGHTELNGALYPKEPAFELNLPELTKLAEQA